MIETFLTFFQIFHECFLERVHNFQAYSLTKTQESTLVFPNTPFGFLAYASISGQTHSFTNSKLFSLGNSLDVLVSLFIP